MSEELAYPRFTFVRQASQMDQNCPAMLDISWSGTSILHFAENPSGGLRFASYPYGIAHRGIVPLPTSLDSFDVILGGNGIGFLPSTSLQLLTVLTLMFSRRG